MKSILTAVIMICIVCTLSAQSSDVGSPTAAIPEFYTLGDYQPGTLNTSTPSGLITMSGSPGIDDVFWTFTAESQGVRLEVDPIDFDAIVEIWEGTTLIQALNSIAGNNAEVLWATELIQGNNYVIRVYSVAGIGTGSFNYKLETLPAVKIRDIYVPTNEAYDTEDGLPGYQVNQLITRDLINTGYGYPATINDFVERTQYRFTNTDTGVEHFHETIGTSHAITFNDIEDNGYICYNQTFDVAVQIMLEGNYCGFSEESTIFTEAYPRALMQEGWSGQEYPLNGSIQMEALGPGQEITWFYTGNNGELELAPHQENNSASSWCNLNSIDCLRYGRIYDVQMRADYCGIEGPISDPITIYTVPYPKTKLYDIYCGTELPSNTAVNCDIVFKAEQYCFQFAPIVAGDPNMIPIGPAILVYSSSVTLPLSSVGLEYGQTYRVGVKSFIQNGDGCDDLQESDYGQFCELSVYQITEPDDELIDFSTDPDFNYTETVSQVDKDKYTHHEEKVFVLDLEDENLEGRGLLQVFDMSGKLVLTKNIYQLELANNLYYDLSNELAQGQYICTLLAGEQAFTDKIFIQ